ncbi:ATP-binding protein [Streptomyces sp. NPDC049906]|uniref:ATP-binding protein n=1 Tax=Streptomyces sp. NPDC049906 TaxID=3155656 RepID=UPI0034253274
MSAHDAEGRAMTAPADLESSYANSITLVAVPTAVPVARMFVRALLEHWGVAEVADEVMLVASELVGNAVKAVGFADRAPMTWEITARHVIGVQLRIVDAHLYVEVWDGSAALPRRQAVSLDTEGGRGLILVENVCEGWDVFRPDVGGKVVWARLPLGRKVVPTVAKFVLPHRVPGATSPPNEAVKGLATAALLQRVLDGLRAAR